MNAHVAINMPSPEPDVVSDECAYRRAISIHCPNCNEFEMAVRVELASIRDQAAVGISRATDSAAVLLGEVSRLATFAVYARKPANELFRVKCALVFTMMAARGLDRVTRA